MTAMFVVRDQREGERIISKLLSALAKDADEIPRPQRAVLRDEVANLAQIPKGCVREADFHISPRSRAMLA